MSVGAPPHLGAFTCDQFFPLKSIDAGLALIGSKSPLISWSRRS
jgi:hypothetical protein